MKPVHKRSLCAAAAATLWALTVAPAQAEIPLAGLRPGITARQELVPLLRRQGGRGPGRFDFNPTLETRAHGYKIEAVSFGGAVAVLVRRREGSIAAYLARGVATSRRLEASLGPFGRLDMRFHPDSNTPLPRRRRRCRAPVSHQRREGTWVGRFEFIGEDGYLSLDLPRAQGSIRRIHPSCSGPPSRRRPRTASTSSGPFAPFAPRKAIGAGWHDGLESVQVVGLGGKGRVVYVASTQEAFGAVGVLRLAVAQDKPETLSVNDALTRGVMSPPPPFHGSGTYLAAPDGSSTWLGDLTVNFPGAPALPLAGERFTAEVELPL
jgi:hypothetical protein